MNKKSKRGIPFGNLMKCFKSSILNNDKITCLFSLREIYSYSNDENEKISKSALTSFMVNIVYFCIEEVGFKSINILSELFHVYKKWGNFEYRVEKDVIIKLYSIVIYLCEIKKSNEIIYLESFYENNDNFKIYCEEKNYNVYEKYYLDKYTNQDNILKIVKNKNCLNSLITDEFSEIVETFFIEIDRIINCISVDYFELKYVIYLCKYILQKNDTWKKPIGKKIIVFVFSILDNHEKLWNQYFETNNNISKVLNLDKYLEFQYDDQNYNFDPISFEFIAKDSENKLKQYIDIQHFEEIKKDFELIDLKKSETLILNDDVNNIDNIILSMMPKYFYEIHLLKKEWYNNLDTKPIEYCTLTELRQIAKQYNISGFSRKNKQLLKKLIISYRENGTLLYNFDEKNTRDVLENKTLNELKQLAKNIGLKRFSKFPKDLLIDYMMGNNQMEENINKKETIQNIDFDYEVSEHPPFVYNQKIIICSQKNRKGKKYTFYKGSNIVKGPYKSDGKRFLNILKYLPLIRILNKTYCEKEEYTYLMYTNIYKWKHYFFIEFPNINKVKKDYINEIITETNLDKIKSQLFNKDFEIFENIDEKDIKYYKIENGKWNFNLKNKENKIDENQYRKIFQHLYFRYILGIGDSGFNNIIIKVSNGNIYGIDFEERRSYTGHKEHPIDLLFTRISKQKKEKYLQYIEGIKRIDDDCELSFFPKNTELESIKNNIRHFNKCYKEFIR